MVRALKTTDVPTRLAANERAAMGTGVEQNPYDVVVSAAENQGPAGDAA
jgi:hypothetical protein